MSIQAEIDKLYKTHLKRDADAGGAEFWKSHVESLQAQGQDLSKALENVAKSLENSTEAQNLKAEETKPEKKNWMKGHDSPASGENFEDLHGDKGIATAEPDDPRRIAFENEVTSRMEQSGLLADQVRSGGYIEQALSDTTGGVKEALQNIAKQSGTAEQRGDVWGAGGGRKFLDAATLDSSVKASTNEKLNERYAENAQKIANLYTEGFNREPDTAGLKMWTEYMTDGDKDGKVWTYSDIAKAFQGSDEYRIRNVYHDNWGRDVDDAGLQHWLSKTGGGAAAAEAVITGGETNEGKIRNLHADILGQYSKAGDRHADFFTDPQEGGYKNLDWRAYTAESGQTDEQTEFGNLTYDFGSRKDVGVIGEKDFDIQSVGKSSKGVEKTGVERFRAAIKEAGIEGGYRTKSLYSGLDLTTLADVRDVLSQREKLMNISSQYDRDEKTGLGRNFTLEEMEPHMSKDTDLKALATKLGEEKWDLLKQELTYKPPKDPEFDPEKPADPGPPIDTPGPKPLPNRSRPTLHDPYEVPIPPPYEKPEKPTITDTEVDYISDFDGTVGSKMTAPTFGEPTLQKRDVRSPQGFMASQSAAGVRRKRSGAFRSGASATGTSQFKRKDNMKIQSLNL